MRTFFLLFFMINGMLFAQGPKPANDPIIKPTGIPSAEQEFKVQLKGLIQPWISYTDLNPGSMDKDNNILEQNFDRSLRRFRLGATLTYRNKLKLHSSVGMNNLNGSGKPMPSPQLLDLYLSYQAAPSLQVGIGKSTWDGLSRYTSPSTSTMMFTDLPFIALPTVNITDKIIRNLNIYLAGDLKSVHYRFVVKKPYTFSQTGASIPQPTEKTAQFSDMHAFPEFTGYGKIDLFDKENNMKAGFSGTYLGQKKILSLGGGFKFRHKAMAALQEGSINYYDMNLWAADIFMEQPSPFPYTQAITSYIGYFDYDLGPNYLRTIGVNNPAYGWQDPGNLLNGKGNSFPVIGSGQTIYFQGGLLFNSFDSQGKWGQVQFYAGGQYSEFDALEQAMISYNIGLNWFLKKHYSKISLDLQNRPLYDVVNMQVTDRKSMVVLQYQYIFN